jgi:hypothetical protein
MSIRSKFLLFVAIPVAVVTVAGVSTSSFTFGQNVSTIQADVEQVNYIVPATDATSLANKWNATSTVMGRAAITAGASNEVKTVYGELPQWTQVSNGVQGYPSTINQPGDLLFINARSSSSNSADSNGGTIDENGGTDTNVVSDLFIKGNITNVADLRTVYRSCLIPVRLWSSTVKGVGANRAGWTDVTDEFLGVDAGQPYYIDCETGQFEFTVPTANSDYNKSTDLDYAVTVEAGGNFATMNNIATNLEGITPEFLFTATPIAEAFTANAVN